MIVICRMDKRKVSITQLPDYQITNCFYAMALPTAGAIIRIESISSANCCG